MGMSVPGRRDRRGPGITAKRKPGGQGSGGPVLEITSKNLSLNEKL